MGLNDTASGERVHIGFLGMRNAGKSSLVNAVTGQRLSVVSDVKGTTTDPVKKAMELLPLGPVVIIDTPGLDEEGELGLLRVEKAIQSLAKTDVAILVADATQGLCSQDKELINTLTERKIPYIIAYTKADLLHERPVLSENAVFVSAVTGEGIESLKERIYGRCPVNDVIHPQTVEVLAVANEMISNEQASAIENAVELYSK